MSRAIDKADGDWKLTADQDSDLDGTEDYVLAEGGVLSVTDSRDDGEHVDVSIYPEDSSSAYLSITADEALSLGQWLVKTFGSGRTCNMKGCNAPLATANKSGYCSTHRERTCTACMAKHRTRKSLCPICRKGGKP